MYVIMYNAYILRCCYICSRTIEKYSRKTYSAKANLATLLIKGQKWFSHKNILINENVIKTNVRAYCASFAKSVKNIFIIEYILGSSWVTSSHFACHSEKD